MAEWLKAPVLKFYGSRFEPSQLVTKHPGLLAHSGGWIVHRLFPSRHVLPSWVANSVATVARMFHQCPPVHVPSRMARPGLQRCSPPFVNTEVQVQLRTSAKAATCSRRRLLRMRWKQRSPQQRVGLRMAEDGCEAQGRRRRTQLESHPLRQARTKSGEIDRGRVLRSFGDIQNPSVARQARVAP